MANHIKKLQQQIKKPLLIRNPQHLFYLTGHYLIDGGFLFVSKKEVVLFGGFLEKVTGLKRDYYKNIPLYLSKYKVIEIDDTATIRELNFLKRTVPKVKFQPAPSPVSAMRLTKDSGELATMKQVYQITAKVFAQTKAALKQKKTWTELELAQFIRLAGLKLGAEDLSFPVIVAAGKNAATPHHLPTKAVLKAGETIILDFGFKLNGYCSDFSRTIFLKQAPEKMRFVYEAVEKSYQRAVKEIRSGMTGEQADGISREHLSGHGLDHLFIHSLGHGTGLEVHEGPNLHARSTDILQNNMVFSIEPGVYIKGRGGVRIEDLVYLKGNKVTYFSKVSTKLSDMVI